MTFRLFIISLLTLSAVWVAPENAGAALNPNDEYIIISGGPALQYWEGYRRETHRHDRWWGNFIRTARFRIEQLQKASNNTVKITWLVYRPGYESRATEDGQPLIANIESVRDKYGIKLVWFSNSDEIINYVNSGQNRSAVRVSGFEYFGHSNKYCFVFDYSNHILGASRAFLHQGELKRLNRKAFARGAYCKSWGCHSGEAFSQEIGRASCRERV